MKTIICAECNTQYNYEPNPNYPDKRKYCANCSEKKKATWDANPPVASTQNIPVIKVDAVDHRTKEFHLTVEECRARALESALVTMTAPLKISDLLTVAKIFEVYIREGVSNANGHA